MYANVATEAFMSVMERHVASVENAEIAVPTPILFEEFFEAERARLFRALLLITYDAGEAEDLMQEAFVRVLEHWERVARLEDPVAYLFRTAMNLYRSRIRRAMTAAKRSLLVSPSADPFDEVESNDEAVRTLSILTPRQRAAIIVTELLGFNSEEAGSILGVQPGTVRTLTSRARSALATSKEPKDE
jgi:RNA polymerase sigma factor (sigma-70 family)